MDAEKEFRTGEGKRNALDLGKEGLKEKQPARQKKDQRNDDRQVSEFQAPFPAPANAQRRRHPRDSRGGGKHGNAQKT